MYTKILVLSRYISVHKFNIIFLPESYLNSETTSNDDNLKIPGCNFIRKDHPSNSTGEGVCVYYKTLCFLKLFM